MEAPYKTDPQENLFLDLLEGCLPGVQPQLAVWPISGNSMLTSSFLMKLQISYPFGHLNRHNRMTHCETSGLAGAIQGTVTPFWDL